MITYVAGSLFTSPAQVLVNTVNTQGVMGKGLALQFKQTYPEMFKKYQKFCEQGKIDIGVLWIYKTPHKWVLNFPTKKHWRNPSKKEYIEIGLKKLTERFSELGIHSVAFPALGCGNGGLDWEKVVKPMMEHYLNKLPADVFVHPPLAKEDLPEHKNQHFIEEWLKSEPMSLAFNEVWEDLQTKLAQKSAFSTSTNSNTFYASITENGDGKFLVVETENRVHKVAYEQLLELWQQFRRHGYLRRGIVSNVMEREMSYLIPVLAELEYVEKIELSETGDFSNKAVGRKVYSGLQYITPVQKEPQESFLFRL